MIANIFHFETSFQVDLSKPIDISIPLRPGSRNVNAWYAEPMRIEPVGMGDWVGDVKQGGSVNFRNIFFNPHGNGTHTECVGHISKEDFTINQSLKKFFFIAQVVSIQPERVNGDGIITLEQIAEALKPGDNGLKPEALIIRTLPNNEGKTDRGYSNTNPAYLHHEAADHIQKQGVDHLLIDLPSVDKEKDDGKLLAHHAFWQYPANTQLQRTITELIYVPDEVKDGYYLLNLQIASFEIDASPSKPLLYRRL